MAVTIDDIDEGDLPDPLQEGLDGFRNAHPLQEIEVVVGVGNFVVVSLGMFRLGKYNEDMNGHELEHTHDEVEVFARLPRNWPEWRGENAKGFGTAPPLQRSDRGIQLNSNWNAGVEQQTTEAIDQAVEFYSWGWDPNNAPGVPMEEPEDLKYAYDLTVEMLQHG